ncbi:MAG: hypothetical protein JNM84_04640 [Planctomycetes bacterium]|nr:hypothetical protein [Planctomycetota bacterium]
MPPILSPVRAMLRIAALAPLLTSWLGAQEPARHVPADPASIAAEPSKNGTFGVPFEISGGTIGFGETDGSLVGVGDHYKTFFEEGGITFTPALGHAVPTNQNLRLRLETVVRGDRVVHSASPAVQPRRSNDAVLYERGEITERYDLRPEGIEQSFVFASQPEGSGDLIVRLRLQTELEASSGHQLENLRFSAGEVGGADIGAVVGIDAQGRRQKGHLNFTGTHLELVLPAEFVSRAAYPLVLDPPISPRINVTAAPVGSSRPEAAYLADTYLVAWEHAYSASDTDIHGQRLDACGRAVGNLLVIDAATTDEREPAVAMVWTRNRFVVVYQRGALGARNIMARTVTRFGSLGPVFPVAQANDDEYEPAVGGSIHSTDTGVIIVWVNARWGIRVGRYRVESDGSLFFVTENALDTNPSGRRPVISKSGGASQVFLVAWETRNGDWIGVRFVGAYTQPISAFGYVATGGRGPLLPSVDGDGRSFVLSYARQEVSGSNDNFDVWFIDPQPPSSPINVWNFTHSVAIENSQGDDDLASAIASINGRSVVAIEDRVGGVGTAYEMWASARSSTGALNGSWQRISEANATTMNKHPSVASRQSGSNSSSSQALFVWTCTPAGAISVVKGILYTETVTPGSSTAITTGCGGLGIRVSGGSPVIGSSLSWQLTGASGFASMWIGLSQVAVPICSNCTLGTPPDITFSGPTLGPIPVPLDPCMIGLEFFTQGADLFGPGACSSPPLRLSDTLRTRIGG